MGRSSAEERPFRAASRLEWAHELAGGVAAEGGWEAAISGRAVVGCSGTVFAVRVVRDAAKLVEANHPPSDLRSASG